MKKVDISKFRKRQQQKKEKGKGDPRFLNYYELKEGETMTIRILPDGGDNDESFFAEYAVHEGNQEIGVKTVPCANNWGERCPICAKSYELYQDGDDTSKAFRKNTKYIAQCVVVDSPIEINENPDGGIIKLIHMPFQMYDVAVEGIMNGTVEDPFDLEDGNMFVIKKTKQGKYNRYDKSYWQAKPSMVPEEILVELVKDENELLDLSTLIPDSVEMSALEEWLDKVESSLEDGDEEVVVRKSPKPRSAADTESSSSEQQEEQEEQEEAPKKRTSAKELLARARAGR